MIRLCWIIRGQSYNYNIALLNYLQKNSPCQHSAVYGLDSTAPDHHSNTVVWWLHPLQTFACHGDSFWDVSIDRHRQAICTGGWVSHPAWYNIASLFLWLYIPLSYLHAKNIIHRDLKSNSILSVCDFKAMYCVVCVLAMFNLTCFSRHLLAWWLYGEDRRFWSGNSEDKVEWWGEDETTYWKHIVDGNLCFYLPTCECGNRLPIVCGS